MVSCKGINDRNKLRLSYSVQLAFGLFQSLLCWLVVVGGYNMYLWLMLLLCYTPDFGPLLCMEVVKKFLVGGGVGGGGEWSWWWC